MAKITLTIGGDLVPTASNDDRFIRADVEYLLGGELWRLLNDADFRIFNLEVPLADTEKPLEKCGPNLIAPTSAIAGIKKINPSLLSLANNHIMDQGAQGLCSTVKTLEANAIAHCGAGQGLPDAAQPWIVSKEGVTAGVYACAEHEFSAATNITAGANPFDPLESYDHVGALKQKCDYVIVLYHGGKECYRYPSPDLQKYCRKFIEKGADLVVCQHSHCVGCMEEYRGGTVVYGQGNFLSDQSESEYWQTGLLIRVTLDPGRTDVDYIPLKKNGDAVRIADKNEGESILRGFWDRSGQIAQDGFIDQNYQAYAKSNLNLILQRFDLLSNSFVFRAADKLSRRRLSSWYFNRIFLRRKRLEVRNVLECEAWRELVINGLRQQK